MRTAEMSLFFSEISLLFCYFLIDSITELLDVTDGYSSELPVRSILEEFYVFLLSKIDDCFIW